jgi:hypothetical protein
MWREENPAGSTAPLREQLRVLLQAAADAEDGLATARIAAKEAREAAAQDAQEAQQARDKVGGLQTRAATARALAETQDKAATARDRIGELTGQAAEDREAAGTLRERAAAIRAANEQRAVEAERHRRDAAGFTRTRADVIAGTAIPQSSGGASLADLKIRYEEADASLRAIEVGEDLQQQATEAEQALRNAAAALADADPETRSRAGHLIEEEPAAADPTARDAAARQARRTADNLESQRSDAKAELGAAGNALKHASPPDAEAWADLEATWVPTNSDEGRELARQAGGEARDARQLAWAAGESEASLNRQATTAGTRYDQFDKVLAFLLGDTDPEPEPEDPEPYPGAAEDADADARAARKSLREARNRHETLRSLCRENAHEMRKITSDPEFDSLSAPIRKQVGALDPDLMPPLAAEWARQLQSRVASLATDLEDADRHRGMLALQLREYTTEALKILRKAERLSVLPASAGPWKDQQVLKIRFAMPDPNVLVARAGDVIDREAREQKQKRTTGLDLVLRCVSEAVPRDFAVSILKPDQAGPIGHVPVERMREVFSEGQELTGAIMLYCTLAAIRIDSRGRAQGRHGGMLILDNPIGKASADYLLTLQMSLAEATGVQLIYTTGLEDDRVQATFPLRIRLRNTTDRRTGDRYLVVTRRTALVSAVGVGSGDEGGAISAIRLMDRADA